MAIVGEREIIELGEARKAHEKRIDDHEDRLRILENHDARMSVIVAIAASAAAFVGSYLARHF